MKFRKIMFLLGFGVLGLASCQNNNANSSTVSTNDVTPSTSQVAPSASSSNSSSNTATSSTNNVVNDSDTTIFLAGDSTVKTYTEGQYIGGWGQYLDLFLKDNVTVKNCAQGGRSSRSFINEGRLYDIEGATYTFSENGGNSIGDEIKSGDYLFIQFGHNDDDTKAANSLAERMVPLGEPDSNGIYPTLAGTKTTIVKDSSGKATDASVSQSVKNSMSSYSDVLNKYLTNSVSKFGNDYYEYSSGGTYKWFLKQYIDFAREKNATPVLVTPVARVSFNSDGTLKSGPGLHGTDFAYVKAVRQLASEENCLLIDLFNDTKTMLETTKQAEANYIMALKDASGGNSNTGAWPAGFDTDYKDAPKESTHYNKFGAFITAGKVAEHLKDLIDSNTKAKNDENIGFKNSVLSNPEKYIAPSNLMHKATINKLYDLFETVNVKNPDFTYPDPNVVANAITKMVEDYPSVTQENYLEVKEVCEEIRGSFVLVNVDDIANITNISTLEEYEESVADFVKANRKVPTEVITFDPSSITETSITSSLTVSGFKLVGTSDKNITVVNSGTKYTYNDNEYTTTKSLSMGGAATFGSSRYIEFTLTKKATVTIVAKSTGSSDRIVSMVTTAKVEVAKFAANASQSITTHDDIDAGTYQVGSAGSGIYIYAIIIEYFD